MEVVSGMKEAECSSLLRDFFLEKRRRKNGEVAESG